jgi:hypothetical protein
MLRILCKSAAYFSIYSRSLTVDTDRVGRATASLRDVANYIKEDATHGEING